MKKELLSIVLMILAIIVSEHVMAQSLPTYTVSIKATGNGRISPRIGDTTIDYEIREETYQLEVTEGDSVSIFVSADGDHRIEHVWFNDSIDIRMGGEHGLRWNGSGDMDYTNVFDAYYWEGHVTKDTKFDVQFRHMPVTHLLTMGTSNYGCVKITNNYKTHELAANNQAEYDIDEYDSLVVTLIPDENCILLSLTQADINNVNNPTDITSQVVTASDGSLRYVMASMTEDCYLTATFASTASPEPYAVLSEGNTVLTFYYDEHKAERNGMDVGPFTGMSVRGWHEQRESITSVVFDASFTNCTTLTSTAYWFSGCSGLTSLDVSNLNTENVTDMSSMFERCFNLTSLDLSNFKTENVTNMHSMFDSCSSLASLNVSNFKTNNVTNMGLMFSACYELTSLDVSGFITENVTDMHGMFGGSSGLTSLDLSNFKTDNVTTMFLMFEACSGLTSLDLSSFNTENVTKYSNMFKDCSNLNTIYVGNNWNTSKTEEGAGMFMNCTSLVGGAGTVYNEDHIDYTYAHIDGGENNPGYFTSKNALVPVNDIEPYAVLSDNNTVLTFYYDDQKAARNGMSVGPFVYDDEKGWYVANSTIETVVFDASFAACSSITSTAHWFERLHSLTTITGMTNLNTSNVTNMERMFRQCINLTSLDMSSFNTSNVTNMSELFEDCSGLTSLDVSGFNTSNVTDMSWMFSGCSSLTSLDVSGFDTSNATDISGLFEGCSSLTSLDVSNLKTDNVTSMDEMFERCSALTSLDVSGFNTSNVTSMEYMFGRCDGLTTLDLSTFNTAKVTNMSNMFRENTGLTSLNLSNFNTNNVTVMEYMFNNCSSMTTLDLSSFNTTKVEDMDGMFGDCSSLTTIYVSDNWTTANVENSYEMFAGCNNLVGGAGTQYNESHIDHTYAHIDGGTANPGYFTAINGTNSEAWFDGLTAYVMGEATLDDAFAQTGGRSEAAKTIAAIIWEGNTALTADMLQGISNPNLLVYVNEPSLAPQGVQNVVINGQAKEIILTDATSGNNNFFCPEPFWAEKISYTRNFQQRSEIGVSRGWEGLALPFNVQTITHETHGELAPFAAGNNSAKPFWLRYYTGDNVESAHNIEAYVPYVIAMPNSNDYFPEYNQAGRVTFSATNTEVYQTPDFSFMENEPNMSMMTIPTFQLKARSDSIYAINVGEPRNNYAEGSVFESGLRDVRPFEIYTVHHGQGARPRFIPIPAQGNESTGIADIKATEPTTPSQWYDLSGRRLTTEPKAKGVYIQKGRKVIR